jgi:hypothetical protein
VAAPEPDEERDMRRETVDAEKVFSKFANLKE